MCRLLGVIASKPVDLSYSLPRFAELGRCNPDGWGMGWYDQPQKPRLCKEPLPAHCSRERGALRHEAFSPIFICHVRMATAGAVAKENCHPFAFRNWLFAHNGSVHSPTRERLRKALEPVHCEAIAGETDSEVYFHWLVQNIEQAGGDVPSGVAAALREISDYTGLNFILTDGLSLYAYRNASANRGYYSLYYLSRPPVERGPFSTQATAEIEALIHSKALNNESAVLVCSEKLTKENWQEMRLGHLLAISPALQVSLHPMAP